MKIPKLILKEMCLIAGSAVLFSGCDQQPITKENLITNVKTRPQSIPGPILNKPSQNETLEVTESWNFSWTWIKGAVLHHLVIFHQGEIFVSKYCNTNNYQAFRGHTSSSYLGHPIMFPGIPYAKWKVRTKILSETGERWSQWSNTGVFNIQTTKKKLRVCHFCGRG